jgi:hypothetical protein
VAVEAGVAAGQREQGVDQPCLVPAGREHFFTGVPPGLGLRGGVAQGGASGSGGASPGTKLARAVALAHCMRAHGLPSFLDPVAAPLASGYAFNLPTGLPRSPQFPAAEKACRSLEAGSIGTSTAAQQQAWLTWAACIRAHGVPSFPDPTFRNGISIVFPHASRNPRLPDAEQACRSKAPAGLGTAGQ